MHTLDDVDNGRQIFRLHDSSTTSASVLKCLKWSYSNKLGQFKKPDPCPCSLWSAIFDFGFRFAEIKEDVCFATRRLIKQSVTVGGKNRTVQAGQKCCYTYDPEMFGALSDLGHLEIRVENKGENNITDAEAREICCSDSLLCEEFYEIRPTDYCDGYSPPRRGKYTTTTTTTTTTPHLTSRQSRAEQSRA